MKKAVVLLSGGLDSVTTLALAKTQGYECYAVSFSYGQRHCAELNAAKKIANHFQVVEHKIINIDLGEIGGSALTDSSIAVPKEATEGIPVTYVPARNTIFLSFALGYAEVLQANDIFIGVNAVDYSGYPDCRPEFIEAFQKMARLATKVGVEAEDEAAQVTIHTPLIDITKAQIIKMGTELGVDYSMTVSCYDADSQGRACGKCDSCRLRRAGFGVAGIADPTIYRSSAD